MTKLASIYILLFVFFVGVVMYQMQNATWTIILLISFILLIGITYLYGYKHGIDDIEQPQ